MRYDCDKRIRRKCEKLLKWFDDSLNKETRVFCFLPKKIGPNDCRWMEYVNRKSSFLDPISDQERLARAKRAFERGDYKDCLRFLSYIGGEMFNLEHTYTPISKEA